MNNSLARLLDGVIETLRQDILPDLQGEFVRGQVFGVIYALKSIKLRAAWSPAFLLEQLAALDELAADIAGLTPSLPGLPPLAIDQDRPCDATRLEAIKDEGDRAVCMIIAWLHDKRGTVPDAQHLQLDGMIQAYVHRQLKHDIATSAKPMFAEISSGIEQD